MIQIPLIDESESGKLKLSGTGRLRKAIWGLTLSCVALGATVVGLGVAYARLKTDCSENKTTTNSQTSTAPTYQLAAPEQFSASNVIMTPLNGQNSTVDWTYDGLVAKETLTYTSSGVQFRKDYITGVSEMMDIRNVSGTCTGFPMTKTSISTFEYETISHAGGTFNALNESCRRFHAVRPDGSTFYFSTHHLRPDELCTLEVDGLEFRFDPNYFKPYIENQTITDQLCPERHVESAEALGIHVQHWHFHWHPSFHPGWLNPEHWWQKLKCTACTRGIGWVLNKVEGYADNSVCSETGPFANACLIGLRDLENKLCQHEDCVNRACSAIHLC